MYRYIDIQLARKRQESVQEPYTGPHVFLQLPLNPRFLRNAPRDPAIPTPPTLTQSLK